MRKFSDYHEDDHFCTTYANKLIRAVGVANSLAEFRLLHEYGWAHLESSHYKFLEFKRRMSKFARQLRARVSADEQNEMDELMSSHPTSRSTSTSGDRRSSINSDPTTKPVEESTIADSATAQSVADAEKKPKCAAKKASARTKSACTFTGADEDILDAQSAMSEDNLDVRFYQFLLVNRLLARLVSIHWSRLKNIFPRVSPLDFSNQSCVSSWPAINNISVNQILRL